MGQPGNSTSASQTYNGKAVPAGGCSGQAQRQIGQLPQNLLADQLDGMSLTASQGNATVVAAIGKWSACMKTHGFTVSSPYDASQLSGQLGAAPGSDLDRTIAVDDVKCKQSTSLVETWFKIEAQLQNQYIAAHQQALHDQQTDLDNAVKNAETIATH